MMDSVFAKIHDAISGYHYEHNWSNPSAIIMHPRTWSTLINEVNPQDFQHAEKIGNLQFQPPHGPALKIFRTHDVKPDEILVI